MRNFELSKEQYDKYVAWREKLEEEGIHRDNMSGLVGGSFSFIFIPTGIGIIEKVRHVSGAELDLTDWDNF